MKKIVLLIVCLHIFVTHVWSQDSLKKIKIGLDFSMSNTAIGKANINPSVTFSKGKHFIFAGPYFLYPYYFNPYRPIYGVQTGYQFYPNGSCNKFNLFFEYNFSFVKGSVIDQEWSHAGLSRRGIEIESLDNYLGFGFKANITTHLYFHSSVGLGVIYYGQITTYKNSFSGVETEVLYKELYLLNKTPYATYNNYFRSNSFIGIVKLGIAYDLFKL